MLDFLIKKERIYSIYSALYRILISSKFKFFGSKVKVIRPLKIEGHENISLQDNVRIGYKSSVTALSYTNMRNVHLLIGEGSVIGNFNHIVCSYKMTIGKNVLFANNVYLSDNLHEYRDIHLPIIRQSIIQLGEVRIGDGSWIGENVAIIGASVGKNSVIGANSVVTKNIPDYCVAVGAPARVIKKYNVDLGEWLREDE